MNWLIAVATLLALVVPVIILRLRRAQRILATILTEPPDSPILARHSAIVPLRPSRRGQHRATNANPAGQHRKLSA